MALVGKGDPRWIVDEREDGKNVNNWHWTEQDVTPWAKSRLEELFKKAIIADNSSAKCRLAGSDKISGEVSVNTRKGKVFFFFELEIKLNWKGYLKNPNGEKGPTAKGTVSIPGLSEENETDFEVSVSAEGTTAEAQQLKELVRTSVTPLLRSNIALFLKELREEKASHVAQTDKAPKLPKVADTKAVSPAEEQRKVASQAPEAPKFSIATRSIKMNVEFRAPARQLFETLTDSGMVSAFTQSRAQISREVGSEFVLFNGNITGKILSLEPNKKIVQDWRFSSWPTGHFSKVTIDLDEKGSSTTLKLTQHGVPESDFERTEQGWKNFFWDRIKVLFGLEYKLVS